MSTTPYGGHLIFGTNSILNNVDDNRILENYSFEQKNSIEEKLNSIGISEFEQLYCINEVERELLENHLEIGDTNYQNLIDHAKDQIGEENLTLLNQSIVYTKGLGALKPGAELITESLDIHHVNAITDGVDVRMLYVVNFARDYLLSNLGRVSDFSNSVCSFYPYIRIKNQGNRGTCVAFSVTSANEYFQLLTIGRKIDLSEQHLYYESKQIDGDDECGTTISSAIKVISQKGQCRSRIWAYTPTTDCNDHGAKSVLADQDGVNYIAACLQLNPQDIDIFKATVVSDGFVCFAIPVYNSWFNSKEVNKTGRITMPLKGEIEIGGHALTAVGFQDDESYPGGGYFIVRNSWGKDWGKANLYDSGYGIIPYKYISDHCWEAYTLLCKYESSVV